MTDTVTTAAVITTPGSAWDQGDIVDAIYFAALDDNAPAVLVTPACDVEQDKVDLWTFVRLFPDIEVARAIAGTELSGWLGASTAGSLNKNQTVALTKKMKELIGQRYPRYHWVPIAIGEHSAHVADFSWVTCLSADEVKSKASRLGRLNSSWREQLPARYVSYMGRVGTTDLRVDDVDAHAKRLSDALVNPAR